MRALFGFALAAVVVSSTATARAQDVSENDWRRKDRGARAEHPGSFAFEVRFGPYWPQVDDEFATSPGPYERVFDPDPQFYFGLEADWLPLRIPYVGMIGPGFGWGFTSASGVSIAQSTQAAAETDGDADADVEEDTSLTIMPMHLSLVARFDELMLRTGVPIVPYGKLGIGLATWTTSNLTGRSVVTKNNRTEEQVAKGTCSVLDADKSSDEREAKGCVIGSDTTWGVHMALGGMIALNWIDPRAASNLYETVGIGHIYLFGEWMNAMLNGLGSRPQMRVGSSTVVTGLAADF